MISGNRVPRDFFVRSGVGESDITIHAGSYHLALREAGIEHANIITYSSILPATAIRHSNPCRPIVHGEVMETIQASASCARGETATAGLIYGWLYAAEAELATAPPGVTVSSGRRRIGGLVCEYSGPLTEEEAAKQLRRSLNELYVNGYEMYELEVEELVTRSVTPTKAFGTAGIWLCFQTFDWKK